MTSKALVLCGLLLAGGAQAAVITVTPGELQGWSPTNIRGAGTAAITATYPQAGNGSLQFSSASSGDKADFANVWGLVPGRTLGALTELSYSYYRDGGSTVAGFLAPALRLLYQTATGESGYLIYEPAYNGAQPGGVATDSFVQADLTQSNVWMRAFGPSRTIEQYNYTLADWRQGKTSGTSHQLGNNTAILGIEVGVGSGWGGSFAGAVDQITFGFSQLTGGADSTTYNFELVAAAVPEPAALALFGMGLLGLTVALRHRQSL